MSTNHEYRPTRGNGLYGDDHESDSDLDLDELDPNSGSLNGSLGEQDGRIHKTPEGPGNIPLRNLRFGGRRGYRRALRDTGDEEDLEALVGGEDDDTYGSGQGALSSSGNGSLINAPGEPNASSKSSATAFGRIKSLFSPSRPTLVTPTDPGSEADEEHDPSTNRTIDVGQRQSVRFPANAVSNTKYTPVSFLPRTLYNEFSFFFNMYFLLVALSQIIPALRIGYLSTYVVPLAAVLVITLSKEAIDDIGRRRRDKEANSERYGVLQLDDEIGVAHNSQAKKAGKVSRNRSSTQSEYDEQKPATDSDAIAAREISKPSRDLKVGDVLVMHKNQRFPADVIILKSLSSESFTSSAASDKGVGLSPENEALAKGQAALIEMDSPAKTSTTESPVNETTSQDPSAGGEAFIRTDQLDGETDWKLRLAAPLAQNLSIEEYTRLRLTAGKPDKKVNDFVGKLELSSSNNRSYQPYDAETSGAGGESAQVDGNQAKSQPLSIDNTAWANTVLASSSTVLAVVIYTGPQTRAALSTSPSRSKTGLLEHEINSLTKILCFLTLALSFILVALEGFKTEDGTKWYVSVMRFLILFSTIVPISLRVNLDMGKTVYAWLIERDQGIPETVVRTSTIPEDLGRIEYLLSDKTGTLTQNEMELKKIHVGTVSYANEAMDEVLAYIKQAFSSLSAGTLFTPSTAFGVGPSAGTRTRREIGMRVRDLVLALALCHNVTPTTEEDVDGQTVTSYQASSPDEIAIVRWTEHVGLRLLHRDRKTITLQFVQDERMVVKVQVLNIFPFTSDSKRMGIIIRFMASASANSSEDGEICFFQKLIVVQ